MFASMEDYNGKATISVTFDTLIKTNARMNAFVNFAF